MIKNSAFGTSEQRCGHFPFLERKMLPVCNNRNERVSRMNERTNERANDGTVYLRDLNTTASSSNVNENAFL